MSSPLSLVPECFPSPGALLKWDGMRCSSCLWPKKYDLAGLNFVRYLLRGWCRIAGPIMQLMFASITIYCSLLLCDKYRYPDPVTVSAVWHLAASSGLQLQSALPMHLSQLVSAGRAVLHLHHSCEAIPR